MSGRPWHLIWTGLTCGQQLPQIFNWLKGWDFTLGFFNAKGSAVKKFRLTFVKKNPNRFLSVSSTLGGSSGFSSVLGGSGSSAAEAEGLEEAEEPSLLPPPSSLLPWAVEEEP